MGKLNIAHHKSYHPYRADNIARVRQDEARAKADVDSDNDRALAAAADARIDALRRRAGLEPPTSEPDSGHINLFPRQSPLAHERGLALAPSKDDLTPWYSSSKHTPHNPNGRRPGWAARETRRKETSDPLAAIPAHIRQPGRPAASSSRTPSDASSARLARESSEHARAQALIAGKKAERARLDGASTVATPSTVHGGYGDMYNRVEVEEARRERTWGRRGREVDIRGRAWDDEASGRRR